MKKLTWKKIGAVLLSVLFMALVILPAIHANAQDVLGLNNVNIGLKNANGGPVKIVANVIQALLGVMGLVAVIIILYAGFIWMTAQGDEDKVKKAKDMLKNGVIGLIIILLAYALATWAVQIGTGIIGGGSNVIPQ
jgi:amino acid transporter